MTPPRSMMFFAACLAAVSTAASAQVQPSLADLTFLPPCTTVSEDIDSAASALTEAGWQVAPEVTEAMIEDIAWMNSVVYFGGDTGGESLDTVLDLQRKSARGLARKADIPQSQTRFLTKGPETLVLAWRKPSPDVTEQECRVAASEQTMAGLRAGLGETAPSAAYAPLGTLSMGDARIDITLLNAARLAGYDAPDAIIFTRVSQGAQGN